MRILCLLCTSLLAIAVESGFAADKPNVLLIYTDDQGSIDAHCYGAHDLITPNIDRLAGTGVAFSQMYAPSAICSASRAGLLTARFPVRAGVPANVSSRQGVAGMPSEEVTIAEMLHRHGYATGHVGKWHLGYTLETMPNGQGFASSFGHMGGCIDNYSHFFYWNGPNRHDLWRDTTEVRYDGQYFPDLMAAECIRFIDEHKDGPFFLYWAINVPHYPMQATESWQKQYRGLESPRRQYAAFVSTMDERIGHVLNHLQEAGLRDNTLIIFQSDHGHSTEERAFGGGGNAGPYRGAKGCLFEGGIRVPSIVTLPDVVPAGEVRDQMATGCDWLPTIAALTGAALPNRHLDGKDLSAVIRDDADSPHDSFYWQLGGGEKAQWAVRRNEWKLLGNPRDTSGGKIGADEKLFLANLQQDKSESRNLAADHPDVVERLQEIRSEFRQSLQERN